jgi:hypothetical protein
VRPARIILVLALALATAACGGGPTLTARALADVMPSGADAPAGTAIRAGEAGPKTLDEFVTAEDVRAKLRGLGFKTGWVTTFASANFPADASKAPVGSALFAANAIVLKGADEAHRAFTYYEARLRRRAKDLTPILTSDLGKESFSFHFSSLADAALPGVAFLFRVGNALFSVVGIGSPDPRADVTRVLAERIAARAEKV